jgi:N-methylhydantoinase B
LIRQGKQLDLPGKAMLSLLSGDIVRIETPGGGGYGDSEA